MSKILKVVLIALTLFLGEKVFASDLIEVKGKEKILVAPDGSDYQWYKNGEILDKEIAVELDSILESGMYAVEYLDPNGVKEVKEVFILADSKAIKKIFLVGDSTVTNYNSSAYPMTGWGQVLQLFINSSAFIIDNRAIGGRSSRSFIEEGRWATTKAAMTAGDYVMIQFGHNDRDFSKAERYTPPADYKTYLYQYVNEARALGVTPILVTPMVLNAWRNGALRNVFTESGAEYVQKMKEVASELKVPLIDLNQKSWDYVSAAGVDYDTRFIYNTYVAGEYPNYPDGLTDYTHFQEMGALLMAKFVRDGLNELKSNSLVTPIANELNPMYALTVNTNVNGAGTITKSMTYPLGATITLKALANTGHTFLNWKNQNNVTLTTKNIYTFSMPANAVTYTAIFDSEPVLNDCAGVPNGSAKLDNCGICSGGTTGKVACVASIQAELACQVDGVLSESSNAGFYGTGYVNSNNAIGSKIEWSLSSTSAQTIPLTFRFANGGTSNRDMSLTVNNVTVGSISFSSTGSFTNWSSSTTNVTLKAGANKIELVSLIADGGPNIDLIALNTNTISFVSCTIDCNNEAGGSASIDNCGKCSGGNTGFVPNASCTDCNGVLNGTATLDNCKNCVGGATGKTACVGLLEAEEACVVDGIKSESSNAGFSGLGYANTDNLLGTQILFQLDASSNVSATLEIRYANGGTTNRDGNIYVNGKQTGVLTLAPTGSWTTWKTVSTPSLNLNKGINKIVFEANTGDGLANIDLVSWSNAAISKDNCTITGIDNFSGNSQIQIYPNPFQNELNVALEGDFEYQIFDSNGRALKSGNCTSTCNLGKELELGFYEIRITQGNISQTFKFIKK